MFNIIYLTLIKNLNNIVLIILLFLVFLLIKTPKNC